jgi:hypothetical protein
LHPTETGGVAMSTLEAELARMAHLIWVYQLSKRGAAFVPFPPKGAASIPFPPKKVG